MTSWQIAGALLALVVMLYAYPRELLPKLRNEPGYQHFVFASAVALSILWSVQAGIKEGLSLHFLLLTSLVLCHGWRIAMWLCLLPTLFLVGIGKLPLADAAVKAARALDIPVVGLDLLVPAADQPDYVFIEANERAGLANHQPQPTAERFIDLLFPLSQVD